MIESTLKIARYCPLVIQGFSNFLGLFQGIMANPAPRFFRGRRGSGSVGLKPVRLEDSICDGQWDGGGGSDGEMVVEVAFFIAEEDHEHPKQDGMR